MRKHFSLGAAFLCVLLLVSCATTFVTETYRLESPALGGGDALTLALISDLHSTVYGEDQEPLISAVREARPDLILLAGDIADDKRSFRGTELLLKGIRGAAPVFYVTGNHEYMSGRIGEIRRDLESLGVIILSDRYRRINVRGMEILVAGVEDPYKKKKEDPWYNQEAAMEREFRELDGIGAYKILIAHRPENIAKYRRYSFDLAVSGHAHGGQWRIPRILPNGLYAPNQGLFPRYTGGPYVFPRAGGGDLTLIVSRGLSVNRPFFPRIYNRPELSVIRVGAGELR
jgi:predicted MPP superfamily phosphohydrolase